MDIITGLLQETDKFFILMARFSGIAFAPVFSTRNIPVVWKATFVLLLTFLAWQYDSAGGFEIPQNVIAHVLLLCTEITIGIILSLVAQFFFAAVQLAGQVLDTQMGFGIMNVVDPLSGTQIPILGNFKYILALLVFLEINGHHYFLQALFDTYKTIPVGGISLQAPFYTFLTEIFGQIFVIGLQLSLPIMGALLFTDLILGIMARTVPQMNIFMVGMPFKILLGFTVLLISVPLYIYLLNTMIGEMITQIYQIIRLMR